MGVMSNSSWLAFKASEGAKVSGITEGRGGCFPSRPCRTAGVTAEGAESESSIPRAQESSPALARSLTLSFLDSKIASNSAVEAEVTKRENVISSHWSDSSRAILSRNGPKPGR